VKHKTFFKEIPIRLEGKSLEALRDECYERDNGCCQECGKWLPRHGEVLFRAHMAHIKGRGRGGSDTIDNVRVLCAMHHGTTDHNPKSVPRKVRHAAV
jgi:5-methylcytosine-specific restriction endonuclease McrA